MNGELTAFAALHPSAFLHCSLIALLGLAASFSLGAWQVTAVPMLRTRRVACAQDDIQIDLCEAVAGEYVCIVHSEATSLLMHSQ